MKIGCAILAGGKSSRMGTDKALLEYEGKSFIERLSTELHSFEERLIAKGAKTNQLPASWKQVADIYSEKGPIGGLHAVLSVCESDAIFLVSCDMPLLQISTVKNLCRFMEEGVDAVISVTEDGRVHPLCGVYKKSVLPIVEEQILSGNNRMMAMLERLKVSYVTIQSEDSSQLKNVNTPKDYLILMDKKNN